MKTKTLEQNDVVSKTPYFIHVFTSILLKANNGVVFIPVYLNTLNWSSAAATVLKIHLQRLLRETTNVVDLHDTERTRS